MWVLLELTFFMTEADLEILKDSVDKVVVITCSNGEILHARIHFVSHEDQDVIYDLVSTTKESQYEKHDVQPAYLIRFSDIDHVEPQK
jgi:small nuclear ribonucleoprotein (snRNP)-like protein